MERVSVREMPWHFTHASASSILMWETHHKSSEGERHLNRTKTYPRSNHDMVATFTAMAALCFAIEGRWGSQSLWLYICQLPFLCHLDLAGIFKGCYDVGEYLTTTFFFRDVYFLDLKLSKHQWCDWDSYGVMPWEFCWKSRCIPDKGDRGCWR